MHHNVNYTIQHDTYLASLQRKKDIILLLYYAAEKVGCNTITALITELLTEEKSQKKSARYGEAGRGLEDGQKCKDINQNNVAAHINKGAGRG